MAESQESIDYDNDLLTALEEALSPPRLAPYVHAADGDRAMGFRLYLWNSRLSKAFLFPLNIAEVTTRNAMHRALSNEFGGPGWVLEPPFILNNESEASRQRALRRFVAQPSPDELVAALSFDFWSNLFRREYNFLWGRPGLLMRAFPNLTAGQGRPDLQNLVASINHFRNRIAHHEPIHAVNHREVYDSILRLIGLRSRPARDWVRRCSTVMTVVRTPPTIGSGLPGLPLASVNIRPPLILNDDVSLFEALALLRSTRPPVIFVRSAAGGNVGALLPGNIADFISSAAEVESGLIELKSHNLSEVLGRTAEVVVGVIEKSATTGDALAAFFPSNTPQNQRPQVLLVSSGVEYIGCITHPILKY